MPASVAPGMAASPVRSCSLLAYGIVDRRETKKEGIGG